MAFYLHLLRCALLSVGFCQAVQKGLAAFSPVGVLFLGEKTCESVLRCRLTHAARESLAHIYQSMLACTAHRSVCIAIDNCIARSTFT